MIGDSRGTTTASPRHPPPPPARWHYYFLSPSPNNHHRRIAVVVASRDRRASCPRPSGAIRTRPDPTSRRPRSPLVVAAAAAPSIACRARPKIAIASTNPSDPVRTGRDVLGGDGAPRSMIPPLSSPPPRPSPPGGLGRVAKDTNCRSFPVACRWDHHRDHSRMTMKTTTTTTTGGNPPPWIRTLGTDARDAGRARR